MSDEREPGPAEAMAEAMGRAMAKVCDDIHAIQPKVREAVRKALADSDVAPYDLTAEPQAHVIVQPGWGDRLKELAPRTEEDHS